MINDEATSIINISSANSTKQQSKEAVYLYPLWTLLFMAQFRKCWSEICSAALRGFTIPGSSLTVAPAHSPPAGRCNPDTRGWCSLWATAPPAPPSPEGGDTCETKATQPVSRRRRSGGGGGGGATQTCICCPRWSLSRSLPSPGTDCCSGWWPHCMWLFSTAPPPWVPSPQQTLREKTEFMMWQEAHSEMSVRFEFFHLYRCSSGPRRRRLCRS